MKAFHNDIKVKPKDIIKECLSNNIIVAYKNGCVYSNRKRKYLGCLSTRGYLVCTLHFKGVRKQVKLHQIVWIAFNGDFDSDKVIDHINRNKTDNSIGNLRLLSAKQNSKNRRCYKGANNPSAKICLEDAKEIRRLHSSGLSYQSISNAFCVSKSLVASIVRRELWC